MEKNAGKSGSGLRVDQYSGVTGTIQKVNVGVQRDKAKWIEVRLDRRIDSRGTSEVLFQPCDLEDPLAVLGRLDRDITAAEK